MDYIYSIIYGIIQGISEWLPISSTGHLILAENLFPMNVTDEFFKMFEVVIQLGSILAVLILFWSKLCPVGYKKTEGFTLKKETFNLWGKVVVGIIPAMILGLLLDEFTDKIEQNFVIATTLILYGVLFIVVEHLNKKRETKINSLEDISYRLALCVGAFQALALIPGTSRSGATILGAIILGFYRPVAAEFSFFLAVPTMFGASFLRVLGFIKDGAAISQHEIIILVIGTIVSFLVSVLAIKFLMSFIKKKDFVPFGYYRIVLGILVLALPLLVK